MSIGFQQCGTLTFPQGTNGEKQSVDESIFATHDVL